MVCSPATRRYNWRVLIMSLIYGVTMLGSVYGFKHHLLTGPVAWIAALLPGLAIVGIFASVGLYLAEEKDEYLRAMMARQTLWASGFALSFATIWGFLEAFDLVHHVESYYIAILWFGGLGFGSMANRLTSGNLGGRGE